MPDLVKIHASLLPGYFDCSRRAACKILKDLLKSQGYDLKYTPLDVAAIIGTAVHAGGQQIMETKIETGESCPESQTIERAMDVYDSGVQDAAFDYTTPNKPTGEKQVIRMSKAYHHLVAPKITPKRTEFRLSATVAEGYELTGKPDIETQQSVLRDTKTGSKLRPYHPQCGAYSILNKSNQGQTKAVCIDFIHRTAISKPQPPPEMHDEYNLEQCEKSAWYIIKAIQRQIDYYIEKENPWAFPANPNSMLCSPKYCAACRSWCEYASP